MSDNARSSASLALLAAGERSLGLSRTSLVTLTPRVLVINATHPPVTVLLRQTRTRRVLLYHPRQVCVYVCV